MGDRVTHQLTDSISGMVLVCKINRKKAGSERRKKEENTKRRKLTTGKAKVRPDDVQKFFVLLLSEGLWCKGMLE